MAKKLKRRKPETILVRNDLYILWKDGHESNYPFFMLRDGCPCASCVDEITGEKRLKSSDIAPNIRIRGSDYVGNYALRINWSDGHNTGLYSFNFLRDLCPCSTCQSEQADVAISS
ncbi:MAG: DUF971 domain-containing protein [SAR324 cluster bacterium]|nr:DUF971 domain-containing protein [SAR324 cluster bacterium]